MQQGWDLRLVLPCRPTERCLKALSKTGQDYEPILKKAVEMTSTFTLDGGDRVSGIRPALHKVKTGRWRGAVWLNGDTGQTWLVDAGFRESGSPDDVYVALINATGRDSRGIQPSEADEVKLFEEISKRQSEAWRQQIASDALHALLAAAAGENHSFDVTDIDGAAKLATVTVSVDRDEAEDEDAAHILNVDMHIVEWSEDPELREAIRVFCEVINPQSDDWDLLVSVSGRTLVTMLADVELKALEAMRGDRGDDRPVGTMEPTRHSHLVEHGAEASSTLTGSAIRAHCGQWLVASRNPVNVPLCTGCVLVQRIRESGWDFLG